MSDLGWNYPPGAEHDPRAPWNVPDAIYCIHEDCDAEAADGSDYCEEHDR